jgi:hypothetical protein
MRDAPPERVFQTHPTDQVRQSTIDLRQPCPSPRFPAPIDSEASPMPAPHCLGLHYPDRFNEIRPEPNHPYQYCPVRTGQSQTRWCPPQSNIQLVTQQHVLVFRPRARLEEVSDGDCASVQKRKHQLSSCDDSAPQCESAPDGIFGKDNLKNARKTRALPAGLHQSATGVSAWWARQGSNL